ncbi:MAG TPA: hypothetical protein VH157_15420, partial [Bryobacteraceae bacterium]|nr:hypothetical protein [Bryobacteraceae bacterium]
ALRGKSAYSTTMFGLRPFDISLAPIDQLRAEVVIEHKPVVSDLRMNAPEAERQIVSGVYQLENAEWRWTGKEAVILLKPPAEPSPLVVRFVIPDAAPARKITVSINDQIVATEDYPVPGTFTIQTAKTKPDGDSVRVSISVDKTFSPQSDRRELGIILTEVGFQNP